MVELGLDGVCVEFPIYGARQRTLRGELFRLVGTGGSLRDDSGRVTITALNEVSFTLRDGDRLGLVGHNGAGKSTLLRVLAGIYAPIRGSVSARGTRVPLFDSSLGFDPECTGRENIALRGILLGLSLREIRRFTPEIIEFSGLGHYIDLPLRSYSTGMMVRLAFAVATCRVPEILLLDEMISMADVRFMERAQRRLDELLRSAGIVVIASHSEEVLRNTCNKALLLEHGCMVECGDLDQVFSRYHRSIGAAS